MDEAISEAIQQQRPMTWLGTTVADVNRLGYYFSLMTLPARELIENLIRITQNKIDKVLGK